MAIHAPAGDTSFNHRRCDEGSAISGDLRSAVPLQARWELPGPGTLPQKGGASGLTDQARALNRKVARLLPGLNAGGLAQQHDEGEWPEGTCGPGLHTSAVFG